MNEIERITHGAEEAVDKTTTVRRVYGEPIERDGTILIPAAVVGGGGGGGGGVDQVGQIGGGSGFGVKARPIGAFVMRDGEVRWEPAVDPEKRFVIAAGVAVLGILALRSVIRRPRRVLPRRHRR